MKWPTARLGDVVENLDSRRIPIRSSDRQAGPYPYYGASGVVDHVDGFLFEGPHLLIAEDGENLRSQNTPVAFMADGHFWVNNHAHVVRGLQGLADTRFICHQLQTVDFTPYLTGSAQPKLNRGSLDTIPLTLPDLRTQRAIAEVLGSLDDKITANERVVALLDQLIRAQVVEHADGDVIRVADLASLVTDRWQPGDEPLPYLGLEHLPRRLLWGGEVGDSDVVTSQKTRFEAGDLLFGKLRPYFHKVVVADEPGVCSTDILVLRAKDRALRGWMWAAVSSDVVVAEVTASSTGTKMPRANWSDLSEATVPWPGTAKAKALSTRFETLNAQAHALMSENRALAATRDTLLLALMSGELSVREVAEASGL